MTKLVGDILYIEPEPPCNCELCGNFDACRPYGPNGKQICWDCMQKDPASALKEFDKLVKQAKKVVNNWSGPIDN